MRITAKSTILQVAEVVGNALDKAGIKAVLTGGACATIHSRGSYLSEDLDLIIQSAPTQRALDEAMASIGFERKVDQYFHSESDFFVEFPRGPLSIGQDVRILPARIRVGRSEISALSPTDSCRDRLAAFYHWNDRQSLEVAILIALGNRVNLAAVRSWSIGENHLERFEEFKSELARARRRKKSRPGQRVKSRRPPRPPR